MERISLPAPRLTVHGRPLDCTTSLTYAGAYQLTLSTVVPQLAVELHSSYLGHPGGETAVSHLRLRPGERPTTVAELQPGRSLPVREGRRLCLYDHLAVLRELVADEAGAQVSVQVAERALDLVDLAQRTRPTRRRFDRARTPCRGSEVGVPAVGPTQPNAGTPWRACSGAGIGPPAGRAT